MTDTATTEALGTVVIAARATAQQVENALFAQAGRAGVVEQEVTFALVAALRTFATLIQEAAAPVPVAAPSPGSAL